MLQHLRFAAGGVRAASAAEASPEKLLCWSGVYLLHRAGMLTVTGIRVVLGRKSGAESGRSSPANDDFIQLPAYEPCRGWRKYAVSLRDSGTRHNGCGNLPATALGSPHEPAQFFHVFNLRKGALRGARILSGLFS
jgi:hypothetical protein